MFAAAATEEFVEIVYAAREPVATDRTFSVSVWLSVTLVFHTPVPGAPPPLPGSDPYSAWTATRLEFAGIVSGTAGPETITDSAFSPANYRRPMAPINFCHSTYYLACARRTGLTALFDFCWRFV